ncbi:YidC/Oxa1 family membrane protein insertase [Candidatus Mycoplasma haematominutum]|uniref:Membrane protein OxaA n=1 Tax=Candidatus Mycoplasma haematominutum 'Birmingham 1' TaxID=1116213 RepID=G8C415_9MOLU|nr:YidC/Oxa1 family membrane protein insertase [Candidatus Mycoplasma haematominutum]CCE67063.1 membrane protein OxaA [Candidatus Mycoplasma haematominutum 'Birmingham 1']
MFLNFRFGWIVQQQQKRFGLLSFHPDDPFYDPIKFYFKKGFKIFKIVLYSFCSLMIAWSFFQNFTVYAKSRAKPGEGLEAAYTPSGDGRTGDYRYDAFPWTPNPWAYWPLISSENGFGPFIQWFVYPFSRLFLYLIWTFKGTTGGTIDNSGFNVIFAIWIILIFMKFVTFFTTFRAQFYSDKQQRHKKNIALINEKYEGGTEKTMEWRQMAALRQREVSEYNKRQGLKPMAPLENFFINSPIFLIVYRLMTITRPVKYARLFGKMPFSESPFYQIFSSNFSSTGWMFLIFCMIVIPVNIFSQKLPTFLMKKRFPDYSVDSNLGFRNINITNGKTLQNVMTIIFICFSLFWSISLAIYYFFNALLNILSNYTIHVILKRFKEQESVLSRKLKTLGI